MASGGKRNKLYEYPPPDFQTEIKVAMLRYGGHRASSSKIRADRKREMGTSLPTWARNCPLILRPNTLLRKRIF